MEQPNKLFVYGILKRGFELDLSQFGGKFLGEAHVPNAMLYSIGFRKKGVGLRFNGDPNRVVQGEVWEIPDGLWAWLDEIEQNGFCYTRKVVRVECPGDGGPEFDSKDGYMMAWVYEYTFPGMKYENQTEIEGGIF